MTIYAIDFDGTFVENRFSDIGPAIKSTVDFVKDIQDRGDKWILWTMREGDYLMEAMDWLDRRGLHPDAVNDNLQEMKDLYRNNPRKVYADVYIDDHNAGGLMVPVNINKNKDKDDE